MTPKPKSRTPKFSRSVEDVYVELEKFVHYLAGKNANPNNVMMEYDELVGELMLEMVKGIQAYPDLEMPQLKAVLRKMMDNRVSELKYRFYATHRSAENRVISLNIDVTVSDESQLSPNMLDTIDGNPVEEIIEDVGADPAAIYDSNDRIIQTREALSPVASRVFDAVIYGNKMLARIMLLASMRASYVFSSRRVTLKPWHLADALHLDEREVKDALEEIRLAYLEVCNG